MTHIAAQQVVICGRYVRQRCAWCGEVLEDVDLSNLAFENSEDAKNPYPEWPAGALIGVDGNCRYIVSPEVEGTMPDDCCALLDVERP